MHCPSAEQLEQFLNGQLTGDVIAAVAAHVDVCRACQTVLESFTGEACHLADSLKRPVTEVLTPTLKRMAQMTGHVDDLFESVHTTDEAANPVPLPAVDGYEVLVGSPRMMKERGLDSGELASEVSRLQG